MVSEGGWKPKASLELGSRQSKASKIAALIESRRPLAGTRLLEVGTGGGIITSRLAEMVGSNGEVWSVDVDDFRISTEGYQFRLVEGVGLPFGDREFDIVVSNHTIEHVGGRDDQLGHLREIARVLAADGVVYLATPSRWSLVEPHFKVPMLSWLPPRMRSRGLRMSRRGTVYDIDPCTRSELLELVDRAGLNATDMTIRALRMFTELEKPSRVGRMASRTPDRILKALGWVMPSMVFLLER